MTYRLFAIALLLLASTGDLSAQYEHNAVIVHLKPNSLSAISWDSAGRSGALPILRPILGEHGSVGYVSTATLKALERAIQQRRSMAKMASTHGLDYIALVRYERSLDAKTAAAKISRLADVAYCEPLPEMKIIGSTNDPLLDQQYYISLIKANEAWDSLPSGNPVIVGIADTGIDTTHQDLQGQIWNNPGETGQDEMGRDKRSNRIDDDGNGFIDDWFGWDFVGSTGQNPDNSPLPGNPHGTHVAGIVGAVHNNATGIAGVARNIRLMPLKIGGDDQFSTSISRSADAILYAASMGAAVINCSFGSPSSSFADVKVIEQATLLGSIIVGAAGNDGQDLAYYPAAYDQVISVAATDSRDRVAAFSNVHQTVDVCAPGSSILSTVPFNRYELYDGTSMASPVTAAVAGMVRQVHPEFTPEQVHATLKAACVSIDGTNPALIGLMGNGRIDAAKAMSKDKLRWATITNYRMNDTDADSVFESTDTIVVSLTVKNTLRPLDSCWIRCKNGNPEIDLILLDTIVRVGPVAEGGVVQLDNALRLILPQNVTSDGQLRILAHIYEDTVKITTTALQTVVNPTYRTMQGNDITVTVNSTGNIGFNDYSSNTQGVGLRYLDYPNILFEGALMLGTGPSKLPNVARGVETSMKEMSFAVSQHARIYSDSIPSGLRIASSFTDATDFSPLGVFVRENVISLNDDSTRNTMLIVLRITNTSDTAYSNLHVSKFFDFDIGDGGSGDICSWSSADQTLYLRNTKLSSLPHVGLSMISPHTVNAFAMDNEGASDCPSIYDEFARSEKWFVMTGGIKRASSRITDVSAVIGAGPMSLLPDSTVEVCFALAVGTTQEQVRSGIQALRSTAENLGYNVGRSTVPSAADEIISISGGTMQSAGDRDVRFRLNAPASVTIDLVDIRGAIVSTLYKEPYIDAGLYDVSATLPKTAAGMYFVRLLTNRGQSALPVFISAAE